MKRISYTILFISFAAVAGADWHVWTETQTVRIVRDTPSGALGEVRMSAARNEWVGFQILVRSTEPRMIEEIRPCDMRTEGGGSIAAENFSVFRQHQIYLTEGTPRNDVFKAGWYPDPLVPVQHPLTGAPLTGSMKALPFLVPAHETHGFWIDIYVPKNTQTGLHEGTITIITDDNRQTDIPIELRIWDFELPDTPTMQTAFGNPVDRMQRYYKQRVRTHKDREPTDWPAVEKQVSRLMSEHRINAAPSYSLLWPTVTHPGKYQVPGGKVESLRSFIDQYHVNAIEVPKPFEVFQDPLKDRDRLHAWLMAIDAAVEKLHRPDVIFYTYLADEPNDWQAYQFVRKWGKAIQEVNSVVKVLVTEQTKPQNALWGDLYGAVDIWAALFPYFDPITTLERQQKGEIIWAYTALCQEQKTPWWHIDYPLLNYRVPAWIAWRYAIHGLLYWDMCHWTEVDDPWTDARTYRHPKTLFGKTYNGEGTLVYPARQVGYDGIVPSLRLKALRRGIQDYEYLAILKRLGLGEEGRKIALSLAISWFKWNDDPEAYERARQELAELIVAAGKGR